MTDRASKTVPAGPRDSPIHSSSARDTTGVEFGEERLRQLLTQRDPTAQELLDRIYLRVRSHVENAEPTDDLTLLGVVRGS